MVGPGPTHEMQRIAVEESRLGIPLLIGLDIIHGHRTLFPIPLGEAALFDPQAWEATAREAAREAAADGLARSEEHTSELQSLMRNSYAVFCLNKKRQSS